MLSRDADSCYWIGRYVERAEATARMVDVHYHAALETQFAEEAGNSSLHWEALLEISGSEEAYRDRYPTENDRDALQFFAFDLKNPDSILSCWTSARENARSIRELLSSEMWESLNVSYLALRKWDVERLLAETPHTYFQMVKDASHLFQGILNRTMLMGEARDWLDAGRFIERGGQTARLLDVKYHELIPDYPQAAEQLRGGGTGSADTHRWIAVLKSVSAFEMYRKTHQDGIYPAHVVEFLALNPNFPASVRHGIGRVEGCLRRISRAQNSAVLSEPERLAGKLLSDLAYSRPEDILEEGLHPFLESVQERCSAIGKSIVVTYLSY